MKNKSWWTSMQTKGFSFAHSHTETNILRSFSNLKRSLQAYCSCNHVTMWERVSSLLDLTNFTPSTYDKPSYKYSTKHHRNQPLAWEWAQVPPPLHSQVPSPKFWKHKIKHAIRGVDDRLPIVTSPPYRHTLSITHIIQALPPSFYTSLSQIHGLRSRSLGLTQSPIQDSLVSVHFSPVNCVG